MLQTINMTKMSNEDLQYAVQAAIRWEPLLRETTIGVTVMNGIVTLSGPVDSYGKKIQAEEAAKNVTGVKAVVEHIDIQFGSRYTVQDSEIANEILAACKRNWKVPEDKINIKVEKGWITLEGEFYWNYQKEAAMDSIQSLPGVKGVTNSITIKAAIEDEIEKEAIDAALQRNWATRGSNIVIDVSGAHITVRGNVASRYEKEAAEKIVWKTPGVGIVTNNLVID